MGYYSYFTLKLLDPTTLAPLSLDEALAYRPYVVKVFSACPYWIDGFEWDLATGRVGDETYKWYSASSDVAEASKSLDVVLALRWIGEDHDEGVTYAYHGRSYQLNRGDWIPAPPDPAQLGPLRPRGPLPPLTKYPFCPGCGRPFGADRLPAPGTDLEVCVDCAH